MKTIPLLFAIIILSAISPVTAQNTIPAPVPAYSVSSNNRVTDSVPAKKWFISRYVGISSSLSFFNGGNASIFSGPVGIQLNHRLSNNWYAFAGVSVAPSYVSFSNAFVNTDPGKINTSNNFFKKRSTGMYSSAALGLMYINDERTFSVSGSISFEKNNYPIYYGNQLNTTKPTNTIPSYK